MPVCFWWLRQPAMVRQHIITAVIFIRIRRSTVLITGDDRCAGEEKIADQIPSYQITIEERNGQEETLTGEQLKLTYQDDGEIDKLMEAQRPWAWVIHAFTGVHVQLENMVAVNEEALKQAVEGLTCMQPGNMQAPKDAYVGITDDGYAVIPEEEGTTLDEEKVIAGLHQALTNGR